MADAMEIASGYVSIYASIKSSDVASAVNGAMSGIHPTFSVSADVSGAASALDGIAGIADGIGNAITAIDVALGVAGAKFTKWALGSASDAETVTVALTNLTGSSDAAAKMIGELQDLAIISPYNFKTLETAGQRIMALGFSANDVVPMLRNVGDAIAATGGNDANLSAVVHDLGVMKAEGKVTSRVMMNLANNSISSWKMLSDYTGRSIEDLREAVKKGEIDADTGIAAMMQGMADRYTGQMEVASKTVTGILSNLVDAVQNNIMMLYETKGYEKLRSALASMVEPVEHLFTALRPIFSDLLSFAGGVIDALTEKLSGFLRVGEESGDVSFVDEGSVRAALSSIGLLLAMGPGLKLFAGYARGASAALSLIGGGAASMEGTAVRALNVVRGGFNDLVSGAGHAVSGLSGPVAKGFNDFLRDMLGSVQIWGVNLNRGISVPMRSVQESVRTVGGRVADLAKSAFGAAADGVRFFGDTLAEVAPSLGPLGGVVSAVVSKLGGSVSFLSSTVAAIAEDNAVMGKLYGTLQKIPGALGKLGSFAGSAIGKVGGVETSLLSLGGRGVAALMGMGSKIGIVSVVIGSFAAIAATAFSAVGGNLSTLVGNLSVTLAKVPGMVSSAMGSFASALPEVTGTLGNLLPSIVSSIVGIVTAIENQIQDMMPNLVSAVTTVATGVASIIVQSAPLVLRAALELFGGLLTSLGQVVTNIVPMIPTMISQIGEALVANIPVILSGATQLFVGLAQGAALAIPAIVAQLPSIIQAIVNGFVTNLPIIVTAGVQLFTGLVQGLTQAIPLIVAQIPVIVQTIATTLVTNMPILVQGAVQLFMAIVQAIPLVIQALIPAIPSIVTMICQVLIENLPVLVQGALQLFMAIVQAIPLIIEALIPQIPTIVETIVTVLIENLPVLIEGAVQLFMALVQAIPIIIPLVLQAIGQLLSDLFAKVTGGSGDMGDSGGDLMQGLQDGVTGAFGAISDWFADLPNKILGAIGSLGDLLVDAGSSIMGGLKSGLESAWGGVKEFVSGIGSWIAEHKGPLSYDRRLLVPAGLVIMGGFGGALEDGFDKYVSGTVLGIGPRIEDELRAQAASVRASFAGGDAFGLSSMAAPTISPVVNYNGDTNNVYAGDKDEYVIATAIARAKGL